MIKILPATDGSRNAALARQLLLARALPDVLDVGHPLVAIPTVLWVDTRSCT